MQTELAREEPGPRQAAPTVSIAVVTHPSRLKVARQLAAELAPDEVRLAIDPDPFGRRGALRAARVAYSAASLNTTHHLVLQEDVSLPPGFVDLVRQSIQRYPDAVLSYFVEWGSPTATMVRWASIVGADAVPAINTYLPTQAVSMPSAVAMEVGRFLREEAVIGDADDVMIKRYLDREQVPSLVTVPNLVEHLDLPSVSRNDSHGVRRSVCVLPGHSMAGRPQRVLSAPPQVPNFHWVNNMPMLVRADARAKPGWWPTLSVLGRWGAGAGELFADYSAMLADRSTPELFELSRTVGHQHLFGAWMTAVAMGAVQAHEWPGSLPVLERWADDPVRAQALRTFTPGALRRLADLEFLLANAYEFAELWVEAMRYGATHCDPGLAQDAP
jgi:hypothetical protein